MINVVAAHAAMMTDVVNTLKHTTSVIEVEIIKNFCVLMRNIFTRSMNNIVKVLAISSVAQKLVVASARKAQTQLDEPRHAALLQESLEDQSTQDNQALSTGKADNSECASPPQAETVS